MDNEAPPSDEQILAVMKALGVSVEPKALVAALREEHELPAVIEALQRALERGHILLDARGMVCAANGLAQAA